MQILSVKKEEEVKEDKLHQKKPSLKENMNVMEFTFPTRRE